MYWYLSTTNVNGDVPIEKNCSSPWYKVSGRYSTSQMVMSMTGRSCKLVLSLDECRMRSSHRMQSSTSPRHEVRERFLTYQMVMSMTRRSWILKLISQQMSNEMFHIEYKVVLVPGIKSEDVPWHTKWSCPWLEGHMYWYLLSTKSTEMFPSKYSTGPRHKVSGLYLTYRMVMSMTKRSSVFVRINDECLLRCSISNLK